MNCKLKKAKIIWSDSFKISDIKNNHITNNRGIYQITKKDKKEELLYIGLVKSSNRTFYQRIREHLEDKHVLHEKNIIVRFGTIILENNPISDENIEEIEGALIFQNIPKLNLSKISYYTKNNDYLITQVNNAKEFNIQIDTSKHYILVKSNPLFKSNYPNYNEAIENLKQELKNGKIYQLETFATKALFNCYMETGKRTLWFISSGGYKRYTSFKNLERYFKGEQIKDERIYIDAIGKYLETIMNSENQMIDEGVEVAK